MACMAEVLKRGWIKGVCARNAAGEHVKSADPDAAAWCLYGASLKAKHDIGSSRWRWQEEVDVCIAIRRSLLRAISEVTGRDWGDEVKFNDAKQVTREDVLKVVERAQRVAGLEWPLATATRRRRKASTYRAS